jgi:Uma2 family endonuclease
MALPARMADFEKTYTSDEFQNLPEFGDGYELIDGKLVKKPMPNSEHSLIARILMRHYDAFDPHEKIGRMLQEISTKLDNKNTPAPDVAFWKAERMPGRSQNAATRPDLAIEIWSPHDLDTKKRQQDARNKLQRYLDSGVPLVWAINPSNQTVEVYQPNHPPLVLGIDQQLEDGDVIPGFTMPVRALFE